MATRETGSKSIQNRHGCSRRSTIFVSSMPLALFEQLNVSPTQAYSATGRTKRIFPCRTSFRQSTDMVLTKWSSLCQFRFEFELLIRSSLHQQYQRCERCLYLTLSVVPLSSNPSFSLHSSLLNLMFYRLCSIPVWWTRVNNWPRWVWANGWLFERHSNRINPFKVRWSTSSFGSIIVSCPVDIIANRQVARILTSRPEDIKIYGNGVVYPISTVLSSPTRSAADELARSYQ